MNHVPPTAQIAAATWYKSSYSAPNNECVETAHIPDGMGVRDSKNPYGPVLTFATEAWASFITDVQRLAP